MYVVSFLFERDRQIGMEEGLVDWKEYYLNVELYNTDLEKRIYVGFFKEGKGENHLAPGTAEEDLQSFAQKVSTHFILLIITYPLECYSKFNSIQVLL